MHNFTPRIFLVMGSPASGKDELIAAVNTIGTLHAEIVPKHTSREVREDDGAEMICRTSYNLYGSIEDNSAFDLEGCDIKYENFGTTYGIKTSDVWDKLQQGIIQVAVVSDSDALNDLKGHFGNLAVVVYVYSQIGRDEYRQRELNKIRKKNGATELSVEDSNYIEKRVADFDKAWDIYVENFMLFDHVLVYADMQEDLFDQVFRLFKAYERGLLK
jgi:ribose 1,5-bisphosphokinase PhnN